MLESGCVGVRGDPVVVIICRHPAWQSPVFNATDLSTLILYYHSLHR